MPTLNVLQPTDNLLVTPQQPFPVAGQATDKGMPEPVQIDSVTVRVDGGAPLQATLTQVLHQKLTTVRFSVSAQVTGGEGAHTVTVIATNDQGISVEKTVVVLVAAPSCVYPRSNATARTLDEELQAVVANGDQCSSFYLDTLERHSNPLLLEGEDHHQGLARTQRLSDGSIYFFLSHSETNSGDKGNLMQFRYAGPADAEHVVSTSPLTVAPLIQLLEIDEQHPCDLVFLPEVDHADAGYLFVAEQRTGRVGVYRWAPPGDFAFQGAIAQDFPSGGPNHLFLDKIDDRYLLGIANANDGLLQLYGAEPGALFKGCLPGALEVSAFQPLSPDGLPYPVSADACQVHLLQDRTGGWFLLAYRCDPPDKEQGTDFVDVHRVEPAPFAITPRVASVHVFLNPGDTSFASTGTHYVEPSGRLLISSSYRWSEDEGPGDSSYVSRVDECPS
jgi:hypothetical protein